MTLLFIKKAICCNILEAQVVYFDFMAYHDYIITLTMAHFYLSGTVVIITQVFIHTFVF